MGILSNETSKEKVNYVVTVTSVKKLEKGYGFTLTVNGVTIYQMRAYEYKNSEGKEGITINFPSYKYNDNGTNKFVNYVFFPLTHEVRELIISQLQEQLKNKKA